jgi:hypothetical protein
MCILRPVNKRDEMKEDYTVTQGTSISYIL